jgi:hypothetical protein
MLSFHPANDDSHMIAHGVAKKTGKQFDIWFNPIYGHSEGLVDITDKMPVLMT